MACPDDAELQAFLNESLTHRRVAVIAAHIDSCPPCQARLDRLTELNHPVMARYKELSSAGPAGPGSHTHGADPDDDTQLSGEKPRSGDGWVRLPRIPGYDVIAELGRGRCGGVYKARHRQQNRLVALRILPLKGSVPADAGNSWLAAAALWSQLQHPQILRLYESRLYPTPQGEPIAYWALELLEGGSLREKLRDNNRGLGPRWPSPAQAAAWLEGLARAVHAAHLRGLVHGHLTPANILFPGLGQQPPLKSTATADLPSRFLTATSEPLPKVTDFGLANFATENVSDYARCYRAPEQATGGPARSPAVDVYALGAILFECLTGKLPVPVAEPRKASEAVANETPSASDSQQPESSPPETELRNCGIPWALAAITGKCLQPIPEQRYPTAEALADDLRRFLDNRPIHAQPVSLPEQLRLWSRRHPIAAVVGAGLILLIAALGVITLVTTVLL
jgi:serine/threonine protein kinase